MPTRTRTTLTPVSVADDTMHPSDLARTVTEALPYGLQPVEAPDPIASAPIDLAPYDEKWRGFKIIVDLDLELRTQEAALLISDDTSSNTAKIEAIYTFLEAVLLAWNFSERFIDVDGRIRSRPLPQPREGGVRRLKNSQLQPLLQAVNSAFQPSPNS